MDINGHKNVLVIIDELLPQQFEFLTQLEFNLHFVNNQAEALAKLEQHPIDLILVDATGVFDNGLRVCRRVSNAPLGQKTPVIAVVSQLDLQNRAALYEVGAADYLRVPLQRQEVVNRIRGVLPGTTRKLELFRANSLLQQETTKRRQLEKQLRRSEQRFGRFISSLSDHIYVTRINNQGDHKNLYISPNVETLTGYPSRMFEEDWRFWSTKLIHPEDRSIATAQLETLIKGQSHEVEYRLVRANGQIIWVRDGARVEKKTTDQGVIIYGVVSDITQRKNAEAVLQQQARRLQVLHETDQAISLADTPETITQAVLHNILHLVPCQIASVILLHEIEHDARMFSVSTKNHTGIEAIQTFSIDDIGDITDLQAGSNRIIVDLAEVPALSLVEKQFLDAGIHALISLPIAIQGNLIGIISIGTKTRGVFDEKQVDILHGITHQMAIAIMQTQLLTETKRRARELAALNKAGQAMTSTLDLNTVLNEALTEANIMLDAEGTAVLLYGPAGNELIFAAAVSPGAEKMIGKPVPLRGSIAGWAAGNKQAVLVRNAQEDPRFYNQIDAVTSLTTHSILAVPLIYREKVIGVIEATNKHHGNFDERDLGLLEALANSAAIAIENARLFEQVQQGQKQLRLLNRKVINAQEEERRRLSYELHDEAGQSLTALKIALTLIQSDLPERAPGNLYQRLDEATQVIDKTMDRLRLLARNLRPPALDTTGLNPTLEGLCRDFSRQTHLAIHYRGTDLPRLPDSVQIGLYRFLQEALTNVAKHAQANQIVVTLQNNKKMISLSVQDDGQGFELTDLTTSQDGIGLLGIQERLELINGRLSIEAKPGKGTELTAHIPLGEN